ncbi:MAG: shikimate dehydrogenase [Verrucomicrobiota bacterium]
MIELCLGFAFTGSFKEVETEKTYTLADLEKLEFPGTPLAVLGRPIKHSVSPAMHNAAIAKFRTQESRFRDWAYYRFEVAPEDLPSALPLFHRRNFLGLNLTVPHKVEAMELIKGVSPDATRMGAVNTLVWGEFGYDGFNTDGYGLEHGLREDLGISLDGACVILLGAGGAARAAAVQCLIAGCRRLYLTNRTQPRLDALLEILAPVSGSDQIEVFTTDAIPRDLPETGVLINATSLGLKPEDPSPFDVGCLPDGWSVYDMIYNPPATKLIFSARERNLPAANGLSMLVHQGARALEIWSHTEVDAQVMMAAACEALNLAPHNH